MWRTVVEHWRSLEASPPGRRFQERFFRNRRRRGTPLSWRRLVKLGSGVLICLAGFFLMPAPGPGWVVFVLGAALISDEFLFVARTLDWGELRVRRLIDLAETLWRRIPLAGKALLTLLGGVLGVGAVYAACSWWFGV
jgi:hypothetical protein